ncbi:MAG: Response regulator receiver [candidate division WWE3 bacterium GW2011_GWA1_41_8]|uniref:Response regulator receiver n=4 Tax=Katanobacteria TaxID=422282 RepID=A0A0G0XCK4_UNCKA|nr:MAG: Response regulator receiver [candidate division WWE3 bacterium GW2011_GWA1_41_8]
MKAQLSISPCQRITWDKNMKKVLIIDDDLSILEAMKLAVEMHGYQVVTLSNAEDAEARVIQVKPDIVLLDVLLSGIDGRDIAYKIKKDPNTKTIPVIMLSASPQTDRSSRDFGADDFLAKPFELHELFKLIDKYLKV